MSNTANKLRRVTVEAPLPIATSTPAPSESWQGIELENIALALSQNHHVKYVWQQLAQTISHALEDHAVAIAHRVDDKLCILAEDGLHDELRQALIQEDPRCPFLAQPQISIDNLIMSLPQDGQSHYLYEFIEHYWGSNLILDPLDRPVYLMLFGPEATAASELARNAFRLGAYVASHIMTEKKRHQLISDLSAETQGRRISAAAALKQRLDLWTSSNDGTK